MPKPLTYPRVLGALKRTFGPAARIERHTEHGVPFTRVTAIRTGERVVLSQRFGPPDFEAILLDGVEACRAWRAIGPALTPVVEFLQ